MQQHPKRSRARILVVGALIGSVLSIGAVSGSASAKTPLATKGEITVVVEVPIAPSSALRSGIRW